MSMVRREVEAGGRRRKSRDALTSRPEIERLLDAASAPASPRELAGEHAAVELFARARLVSTPAVAVPRPRSTRAGFKAAAAGVLGVVVFTSGVSFAATGHVPFAGTLKKVTHAVTGQSADEPGSNGQHGSKSRRGGNDKATPQGPKAAALQGLCRAYEHGRKADQGKAHQTRPAQALVTAAGGVDQVADFCASLPAKSHQGTTRATHPAHPTHPVHPTQAADPTQGPNGSPPTGPGANNGTNGNHGTGNNGNDPTKPTHPTHPTHPPKPSKTPKPSDDPSSGSGNNNGNGNGNGNTPTHKPKPTHTGKPTPSS
jgi:hypothetical protein